jgi:2-keto-4-pentenoate hydratase
VIDPRLESALAAQLADWRAALANGAERVGWKLGIGDRERIGGPVIGHLTSASLLRDGSDYEAAEGALHADAEVALEMGRDLGANADEDEARAAIARYVAALELVDLAEPPVEPEAIVAANVFHRAIVLSSGVEALPLAGVEGRLIVNGEVRASAPAPADVADRVLVVARLLDAMGERLRAGDRIITGSVVQVPVAPGDTVVADLGALGSARATITVPSSPPK